MEKIFSCFLKSCVFARIRGIDSKVRGLNRLEEYYLAAEFRRRGA